MRTRRETADFVERAPARASVEREVDAPPARVFEVLADAPGWTRWWPHMKRCEWTTPLHAGVGAERLVVVNGLKVHERFVAWEPGVRFGFTFLTVNIPATRAGVELAELIPIDRDRTLLRYTMAVDPYPPLSWLWERARPRVETGLAEGLAGLDGFLAGG
jgi:uncharacterized protein YndB with AHSA1/START domain